LTFDSAHILEECQTQNIACKKKIAFLIYRTVQLIFSIIHLTLEGKGGADLVAGLVELGSVEGKTKAEGGAGVELGAVGKGGDTAVVDLDLGVLGLVGCKMESEESHEMRGQHTLAKVRGSSLYLEASSRPAGLPLWTS
jgi:hypothetical protein